MAAVLACGTGAVLSHQSAAQLWGMDRRVRLSNAGGRGNEPPVDVTVPGTAGRKRPIGISLHRSRTLSPADCTRLNGIPVTKPARTLKDLRRTLPSLVFASMLREAEFLGLSTGEITTDHTRSELERRFLALIRRHRLPQPEVNARLGRFVVDFLWRERRLIAEVDGWAAHRTRSAFEADRARDAQLTALGYRVVRFTWSGIVEDHGNVARTLRALLGVAD